MPLKERDIKLNLCESTGWDNKCTIVAWKVRRNLAIRIKLLSMQFMVVGCRQSRENTEAMRLTERYIND